MVVRHSLTTHDGIVPWLLRRLVQCAVTSPSLPSQRVLVCGALRSIFTGLPLAPPGSLSPLLFRTDKLFTPHQRRLPPDERHLSALSRPFSISLPLPAPLLLVFFHPHVSVVYPICCTEPLNLSALCKNKTSFLLCKLYLYSVFSVLCFLFHLFGSCGFIKTRKPRFYITFLLEDLFFHLYNLPYSTHYIISDFPEFCIATDLRRRADSSVRR